MESLKPDDTSLELDKLFRKLRITLERRVMELCEVKSKDAFSWVDKFNDDLGYIVDINKDIRELTIEGKIEEAAQLAKKKLEELHNDCIIHEE